MPFDARVEAATRRVAQQNRIDEAVLLAVVEVECSGNAFEYDNVTPRFLYERHIFYKQLPEAKRAEAVRMGLANETWQRTTQYKDQGTSKGRLALLGRAIAFAEEAAYASCSWGIGQIMGFHAKKLGYGSATAMYNALRTGGIAAQVDCMLRFIREKNLIPVMNRHDWAGFAKAYNGAAYAQNDYDTRLEAAYDKWKLKSAGIDSQEVEELPLGRTPVQNAEPSTSAWRTPEGIATTTAAGTGVVAALKSDGGKGPLDFALAGIILVAALVGGFYFFKRLKRNPE